MKFEKTVTLKITEEVPDELVSRPYSDEEFCEVLKSLIKSELSESGHVEILEDFVHVVRCEHCMHVQGCKNAQHLGLEGYCSNGEGIE